jgi:transcriptional regulator GlxA family with amidase domain
VTIPQHHGFLLLPRFSLLGLAGAVNALVGANEVLELNHYSTLTLSLDGAPVRAACGTLVTPTHALAQAPLLDAAFVLSDLPYPDPQTEGHNTLHAWLRAQASAGRLLGGIGTGAAVLAQAGVLGQHRATLHWALGPQLAQTHADVVVSSHVYEIDRGRLSCTGGTASLDMMLAWLGQRHGERVLQALLAHFGLERLRAADERQVAPVAARTGMASAKLTEAVSLMEANLGEPLPTEEIAQLVGVSRRQLERLFKQHLDELPSRYYAELRLARARRLLQQTSQSILQIALSCGFASGSHFSNAYRARFERTPREERSQRAAAWREEPQLPAAPGLVAGSAGELHPNGGSHAASNSAAAAAPTPREDPPP